MDESLRENLPLQDRGTAPFHELQTRVRLERLEKVRCLLASNFSNKEIAIEVGVSEIRIRKDVVHILTELGCSNRREAGRLLLAQQGVHVVPGKSETLSSPVLSPSSVVPAEEAGHADRVREERAIYIATRQSPDIGLPFRSGGGRRNTLSLAQRLVWIVLIASIAYFGGSVLSLALNAIR